MRANLSLDGVRFGVGAGWTGARGLRLEHERLPHGTGLVDGRVWGLPLEAFVGYAFRKADQIRPYLEARATLTVVMARAQLHHPELGGLGRVRMHAPVVEVVGRAGVLVPLGEVFFVDASVGRTMVGPGAWVASLGLGIPIPTANL